jgi:primase-polymerase (primpol)-like protein
MNASPQLKHFNTAGLQHIPSELLLLPQAITWQAGKLDPNTGKFSKFPKGKDGTGTNWPNSNQWVGNLSDAIALALIRGHSGPGVVLPAQIDGKHLVAFDWDGVDFTDADRMNEILQDWEELDKPYMEISPSGKGLRAFVLSDSPVPDASNARRAGGKDELFCSSKARWITVTGDVFKSGGLSEATKVALAISLRWKGTKPNKQSVLPIQKHIGEYIEIVQPTSM